MIELRHDGPVEVVTASELARKTKEGYLLLGTYETTEVESHVTWDPHHGGPSTTGNTVTRRMFLVGQRSEDAMAAALREAEHALGRAREEAQEKSELRAKLREAESKIADAQAREAQMRAERDASMEHRRNTIAQFAKGEAALAELREKYKKLRTEVGEARARELLGE